MVFPLQGKWCYNKNGLREDAQPKRLNLMLNQNPEAAAKISIIDIQLKDER